MTDEATITPADQSAAAQLLFSVRRGGTIEGELPAELLAYRDAPPQAGLALQLDVLDMYRQAGETQGGWKVAWTSRGARDRGGKDFRPFGYILAGRIHPSGARLDPAVIPNGGVEAEICLTIGTRLAGEGVTPEEVRAAVRAVSPAFEIVSRRLPEVPLPVRIGNGMNNWGLIVGPEHDPDLELDKLPVELKHNGEVVSAGESSPEVLDDPYLSVARVCAVLHRHGLALEPGQRLITGSILPSVKIAQGGTFEATFGPLGAVRVDFG